MKSWWKVSVSIPKLGWVSAVVLASSASAAADLVIIPPGGSLSVTPAKAVA